ncbi:MAG: trypsin-like serine protease [Cyanothece sp. SIO1E1]|nr:trypsin-like serine protease [Cyanothece sp. SIO1E1]
MFNSTSMAPSQEQFAVAIPVDDPDDPNYIANLGQGYDGVVLIKLSDGCSCTGTLLTTGRHILTAAHCFETQEEDGKPTLYPQAEGVKVIFDLSEDTLSVDAKTISVHPEWSDTYAALNDIAILELAEPAPAIADRYEIYRKTDEVGQVFVRVGFGNKGTGWLGEVADKTSVKRMGSNRYDAPGEALNPILPAIAQREQGDPANYIISPGTQLASDFDNGQEEHDAFGIEFGIRDLGLGDQEVGSSTGDSGGPTFIDGKIAGITSYGFSPLNAEIDVNHEVGDASFGEYAVDTRVSAYAEYIDQVLAGNSAHNVHEMGSVVLLETSWLMLLGNFVIGACALSLGAKLLKF